MVCVDEDCEGHAECKKGKCECKKSWEGDKCDRKKVHVDVDYSLEFTFAEEALGRCFKLLTDLEEDIEAAEDDLDTSFTTVVSGSKDSSYDIDVTVAVNLGRCMDRDVALASIAAAIDDVSVPSKLSGLSLSRWSRD